MQDPFVEKARALSRAEGITFAEAASRVAQEDPELHASSVKGYRAPRPLRRYPLARPDARPAASSGSAPQAGESCPNYVIRRRRELRAQGVDEAVAKTQVDAETDAMIAAGTWADGLPTGDFLALARQRQEREGGTLEESLRAVARNQPDLHRRWLEGQRGR